MTDYWKAVRPDGTDFHSGAIQWIPEGGIPAGGWLVEHPTERRYRTSNASRYLSVATVPTDCTGMDWPCRLLRVEPVGRVGTPDPDRRPHKRCAQAWRVVEELDPHLTLGPQGREVAAIIERAGRLSAREAGELRAAHAAARSAANAWCAAHDAARSAARDAASDTTWDAIWVATGGATRNADAYAAANVAHNAALAELVRDLISDEHYRILAGPWLSVVGEVDR